MPKELVKTPWFPSHVLPVRSGVYEVGHSEYLHPNSKYKLTGTRRYYNAKKKMWFGGWFYDVVSIFGCHHSHQWRGVLK